MLKAKSNKTGKTTSETIVSKWLFYCFLELVFIPQSSSIILRAHPQQACKANCRGRQQA